MMTIKENCRQLIKYRYNEDLRWQNYQKEGAFLNDIKIIEEKLFQYWKKINLEIDYKGVTDEEWLEMMIGEIIREKELGEDFEGEDIDQMAEEAAQEASGGGEAGNQDGLSSDEL